MRYLLLFAAACLLMAMSADIDWKEWQSEDGSMSIRYPDSWNFNASFPGTVFSIKTTHSDEKDLFREFVTLIVTPAQPDLKLKDYVAKLSETRRGFSDVKIISQKKTKHGGIKAYEIVSTGSQATLEIQRKHLTFIHNQQYYLLSYTAEKANYNQYLDVVQEMFDSFKVQ